MVYVQKVMKDNDRGFDCYEEMYGTNVYVFYS